MERAEAMYSGLLGSLARSIECAKGEKSSELLMIAVLLGLYEVCPAPYFLHALILTFNTDYYRW